MVSWYLFHEARRGCLELTWPLLVVIGVGLAPFAFPLLCVYIGKLGGLEPNTFGREGTKPRPEVPPDAPAPPWEPVQARPVGPGQAGEAGERAGGSAPGFPNAPISLVPDPNALTREEKKMLRTLWKQQKLYLDKGEALLWGFTVGPAATDYPEFVLAYGNLAQRGFVNMDPRNLVFLSDPGINYCRLFADRIGMDGEAWTKFAPA